MKTLVLNIQPAKDAPPERKAAFLPSFYRGVIPQMILRLVFTFYKLEKHGNH
jgi:hypothetical protein